MFHDLFIVLMLWVTIYIVKSHEKKRKTIKSKVCVETFAGSETGLETNESKSQTLNTVDKIQLIGWIFYQWHNLECENSLRQRKFCVREINNKPAVPGSNCQNSLTFAKKWDAPSLVHSCLNTRLRTSKPSASDWDIWLLDVVAAFIHTAALCSVWPHWSGAAAPSNLLFAVSLQFCQILTAHINKPPQMLSAFALYVKHWERN